MRNRVRSSWLSCWVSSGWLAALLWAPPVAAVTIDWRFVGNPGNACETQPGQGCFGSVASGYNIGTYEVTNAQYADFLNAVADTDTNSLYSTSMGSGLGGITRTGLPGSFSYSAIAGRENKPVNYVDFYDSLRFANWLNNGQPTGLQNNTTTEGGAYTITPAGIAANTITRNPGATIFLADENEWYKAAYHNAIGLAATDYFDYPAGSNTATTCSLPTATPNSANCNPAVGDVTNRGSYTGSPSPYGTFDQGGNVYEWTETIAQVSARILRGGAYNGGPATLAASTRTLGVFLSGNGDSNIGFRVAAIPEPGTGSLVMLGLIALARRARRSSRSG